MVGAETGTTMIEINDEMAQAERKAWDALCRYKFWMFGYWAAIWIHLNRVSGGGRPNPFGDLVRFARERHRSPARSAGQGGIVAGPK
jgi:hypothetical protein